LRQLVRHKQAVAIIDTAPPIKFSYPPFAPCSKTSPSFKGTPIVVDFPDAEAQRIGEQVQVSLKLSAANSENTSRSTSESRKTAAEKEPAPDPSDQPSRVSSIKLNSVE